MFIGSIVVVIVRFKISQNSLKKEVQLMVSANMVKPHLCRLLECPLRCGELATSLGTESKILKVTQKNLHILTLEM